MCVLLFFGAHRREFQIGNEVGHIHFVNHTANQLIADLPSTAQRAVVLARRWTLSDLLRLTFWRTVFPAVALLLVAMGFGAIYDHNLTGLLWLVAAAIVAMVGMVRLRLANGMKLQEVKSGAVYKRIQDAW